MHFPVLMKSQGLKKASKFPVSTPINFRARKILLGRMQNVNQNIFPRNKWFNKMLRFTLDLEINTPERQLREDSCEEGHTEGW